MYLQMYQKQLESDYMVPPPPQHEWNVEYWRYASVLLGCHVVTSPKLQVDWINAGVVYILKST